MTTVYNPDEARHFAKWLEEECGQLSIDVRDASREMVELQANWRDWKYDYYTLVFDECTLKVMEFVNDAEAYVGYLRKKADLVDEYLR